MNKPLRPALEAIYKQTAQNQVRRVLGYVVPDPGEDAPPRPPARCVGETGAARHPRRHQRPARRAHPADLDRFGLARAGRDSRNERHGARAPAGAGSARRGHGYRRQPMAKTLWPGYVAEHIDQCRLVDRGLDRGEPASGSRGLERAGAHRCAARESVGTNGFRFVPHGRLDDALHASGRDWAWGQTTLVRLADMTMDLLKRAVMLAPVNDPQTQGVLVQARADLRATLDAITAYSHDLDRFWTDAARRGTPPQRKLSRDPDDPSGSISTGSATNIEDLDPWLAQGVAQLGRCLRRRRRHRPSWRAIQGRDDAVVRPARRACRDRRDRGGAESER